MNLREGERVFTLVLREITWWIALALGVIGLVANLLTIPVLSGLAL